MYPTFVIAKREFRQKIRSRGFWLVGLGVPLVMLVIWALTGGLSGPTTEETAGPDLATTDLPTVGYVDQADLMQTTPDTIPADMFRSFDTIQAAETALDGGDIAAYYIIPADYRQSGDIERISPRLALNRPDVGWFNRLLAANLLPQADPDFVKRLRQPFYGPGPEFVNVTAGAQPTGQGNRMLPLLVTIAVIVPLFTGGSYLFQSLTQEKSSRIMEILLVSVRPRQLLTGKLMGLGLLIGVQYVVWAGLGLVALLLSGRGLTGLSLSPGDLLLIGPFALGGFVLYAALMAGIGALARDVEDSRIWLFLISLPMMIPIYLWATITADPNGLLAVALSLFPFSAPVAMLMRLTGGPVPAWQIGGSLLLLLLTGLGTIWLMARLFHVQTLLSGESLSLRRFVAALRG